MSSLQSSCPACGGPIAFKTGSSIVVICEYCNSAVARGDRRLEDLGKVAELIETGSPLDVGIRGSYRGTPFELTGRAQLGHASGGVWDEWYAAFADGRWGWLAEAQGRFYMTFQKPVSGTELIPPFEMLQLGQPVPAASDAALLTVAETGEAEALGAKGEIPYRLVPGERYRYADLSGPRGEFATLDYSGDQDNGVPSIFVGREVTLAELGIAGVAAEREARRVSAVQLSCPQCGGPLDLRAPDKTERVTCPNCGSLLDVNRGRLKFLKALAPWKVVPVIALGSTAEFDVGQMTVIGFMQRSVEFSGVRYFWEEYLLYNPQIGFRWLVRSDEHWNFVEPVAPGAVLDQGRSAIYDGKRFKIFQDAPARVEHVLGEFYWKVEVGEMVQAADYVRPPYMLSKEVSVVMVQADEGKRRKKQQTGEINWSLGTYLPKKKVEKLFGVSDLPDASTIAPNQPFLHKSVYKYWAIFFILAFILGIGFLSTGSRRKVFEASYALQPLASAEGTQVIFSDPFQLEAGKNIRVTARAPVDNSWLYVEGDLIDESTGLVQSFSIPVEYYHGSDSDGSWSEGGQSSDVFLSTLPDGKYTLRLEASWERWQQPQSLQVKAEQGVPRLLYLVLALIGVSLIPIAVAFYHMSFESRRWKDSDFNPYSSE